MVERLFEPADLEALRRWDTPTICNALEVVAPARRGRGFTHQALRRAPTRRCRRSAAWRARDASAPRRRPAGPRGAGQAARLGWYEYVADADLPTVVVLEDLDETPGTGAFWGEVNTNVHKGLGALGCVTNGSFRDLDMLAPGFQIIGVVNPSHAYVHVVDFGGEVAGPRHAVLA